MWLGVEVKYNCVILMGGNSTLTSNFLLPPAPPPYLLQLMTGSLFLQNSVPNHSVPNDLFEFCPLSHKN